MRTFEIFDHEAKGVDVVKEGFSWPAFFFTWIWCLVKHMWGKGVVLLLVTLGLALWGNVILVFGEDANVSTAELIYITAVIMVSVYCGDRGNKWRKIYLIKSGYKLVGEIEASTPGDAFLSFSSDQSNYIKKSETQSATLPSGRKIKAARQTMQNDESKEDALEISNTRFFILILIIIGITGLVTYIRYF